ncbi:zinc ABC transporter substrate-binding protein [Mastigocoleus sp. MO_188.B34]|uniref:metal ABC transporter solute-binding protein, Zn/Mn family n=1 Tax=Mastigocoleus sp. MO_188.B34 TaxID=3036635 RepID=UPI002612A54E|nr:zinc ABC transporter substrate-binding protein [Mastigocoleus sp. MO_188.B34]MDJ0696805.1 zinc ABC transporter substrate-binding protein [Mastigocoleus sp. MO_188.B34]
MLKTAKIRGIFPHRVAASFAALALTMGLFSCSGTLNSDSNSNTTNNDNTVTTSNDSPSGNRPSVVATTSVLCDLTKQLAAQTVDLKCLVDAGQDPHAYQATPEDRKAITTANLILYGGYNFEPGIIKLIKASSNQAPAVAVHEVAVTKPIMGEAHKHDEEKHAHEEEHAEEEKTADPHVWHDAENGIRMVEVIRTNLEKVSPDNVQLYASNAENITNQLKQLDTWITSQIATIPANQRQLFTTHDAMNYYVNAYGLEFEGALEGLSTEEQPTAARIGELVKEIKKEGVPTIFAENANNPKLIERVAQEANVKVSDRKLYADGLGEEGSGAETYQKMLVTNTRTIVEELGGNYTAFAVE